VFDYRTIHRAQRHVGKSARPVLYITACRAWFDELSVRDWPRAAVEPFLHLCDRPAE
jgi:hypothetical protein